MNIDRVSATAFMTKDIHIAFEQPRSGAHRCTAGDHCGQCDALEACVHKGVEYCLGHVPKASLGKVGGEDGKQAAVAFENAYRVYADSRYEDRYAHPGGCGAHDAGAENREHEHNNADYSHADVII